MSDITTPPQSGALRRRIRTHPETLASLRDALARSPEPTIRALATAPPVEPVIALADAFAVVSDIVAFYCERIADEAYLRTATERRSVRELTRMLGTEPAPGFSARAYIALEVDDGAGSARIATVPAGTVVQSLPGPGETMQTFETEREFTAHAAWNAIPLVAARRQVIDVRARDGRPLWLRGQTRLRAGDLLLAVRTRRIPVHVVGRVIPPTVDLWVTEVRGVEADPPGAPGWTRAAVAGWRLAQDAEPVPEADAPGPDDPTGTSVEVFAFERREQWFGALAPDPNLLMRDGAPPPGASGNGRDAFEWDGYAIDEVHAVEVDGDHPEICAGSWIVVAQAGDVRAVAVATAHVGGASRWAMSGRMTTVATRGEMTTVATRGDQILLPGFTRRGAVIHTVSGLLPTADEPILEPIEPGSRLSIEPVEPPLARGTHVIVAGYDGAGLPRAEHAVVVEARGGTVTVEPALTGAYVPGDTVVRANVTPATHGETTHQVLGSGDGHTPYLGFPLLRGPLTQLLGPGATGAEPALEVRVDGVRWHRVAGFAGAGPADRVFRVLVTEAAVDGADATPARVVFGDGVHGAIPPTGLENVVATYRVGVGLPGAVGAGRLRLLPQRPYGVLTADNPLPATDYQSPDDVDTARVAAPLQVRTLGRVVSAADYADFAARYPGVGRVRVDVVWDGRRDVVVLSLRAFDGAAPSGELLAAVTAAIDEVQEDSGPWVVLPAEVLRCTVQVGVAFDPDHVRADVESAIALAVRGELGVAARPIGAPVTAAAVLMTVRAVPGVRYCTMPVVAGRGAVAPDGLLRAEPARWDSGAAAAAQLLALDDGPGAVTIHPIEGEP